MKLNHPEYRDIVISAKYTILDCYRLLDKTGYRVLICVENGQFLGIVTDSDIRHGFWLARDWRILSSAW